MNSMKKRKLFRFKNFIMNSSMIKSETSKRITKDGKKHKSTTTGHT
jgi:hypothetical protein